MQIRFTHTYRTIDGVPHERWEGTDGLEEYVVYVRCYLPADEEGRFDRLVTRRPFYPRLIADRRLLN